MKSIEQRNLFHRSRIPWIDRGIRCNDASGLSLGVHDFFRLFCLGNDDSETTINGSFGETGQKNLNFFSMCNGGDGSWAINVSPSCRRHRRRRRLACVCVIHSCVHTCHASGVYIKKKNCLGYARTPSPTRAFTILAGGWRKIGCYRSRGDYGPRCTRGKDEKPWEL